MPNPADVVSGLVPHGQHLTDRRLNSLSCTFCAHV